MEPNERPNLDGPPPATSPTTGSFEFNRPTIIALLYLVSVVTFVTAIVGVVLAYVWKSEPATDWEISHFEYQIRTFWIGIGGAILGGILLLVLIGVFVLLATAVLVIVRTILSLLAAQKREAMPNPESWLI